MSKLRRTKHIQKKNQIHGNEIPDLSTHLRILRFMNRARIPEDLMVAPPERRFVDEEQAHSGDVEHHQKESQLMKKELAVEIIRERNKLFPNTGFVQIGDVFRIIPALLGLLKHLIASFGPANYGRWDLLYPLSVGGTPFAIEHSALLHTYEVIFLADGTDTLIWDPSNEMSPVFTKLTSANTGLTSNLVCCGHSFLSDGQLLAVGGGGLGWGVPTSVQGWRFNPMTRKWNKTLGDMSIERWYPTVVTLGDESGPTGKSGRCFVASGGHPESPLVEIYSEASDTFSSVSQSGATKNFPQTYPGLHLLPGGEIFYVPTGFGNCSTGSTYSLNDRSAYFTFSGLLSGGWIELGSGINRTKGMSALILQPTYPFVRVIVVGGGSPGTSATAQMINLSTFSPSWGSATTIPDGISRVNVNVVLLADGSVFVCGGTQSPPHTCWIYDPNTAISPWKEMDELNSPRHYHSCALLLPSAKVMAAGGAASGGCTVSVENSIEVFSPPYLFNWDGTPAARPIISKIDGTAPGPSVTPTVHHGSSFVVETPQATEIAKVVLIRPTAVTHQTNTEQRVVHCSFAKTGVNSITGVAPDGIHPHAMVPRGYYMLFIINNKGVPSEGKFIHLH